MFFHGMYAKFLATRFTYLIPDAHVSQKNLTQLKDRANLVKQFGFEPVHLLESSGNFPVKKCVQECHAFGDVIFVFRKLSGPVWQISDHEICTTYLDMRSCDYIFCKPETMKDILQMLPDKKIYFTRE